MAMEKIILAINIGSSSKKYSLYKGDSVVLNAHFEKAGDSYLVRYLNEEVKEISTEQFDSSLEFFNKKVNEVGFFENITGIGFRIVAPGTYFTSNRYIDQKFLEQLSLIELNDPAHIGQMIIEINKVKKIFPNINILAVSDSAFHKNMPEVSKEYALSRNFIQDMDIHRFGFHGVSLASIVSNKDLSSVIGGRVIICHLGSGCSVTALLNSLSVDTSMGYSPVSGLTMSSRVGDIDVGATMRILEKNSPEDLRKIFYTESGLLAISELSSDMRILLDAEKNGNKKASLAVETFIYNIQKYIGAYVAVLGGIDAIVFSGTIGERSFVIRERICNKLAYFGVKIDSEKNENAVSGTDISSLGEIKVFVIHSDEASEIRKIVAEKIL